MRVHCRKTRRPRSTENLAKRRNEPLYHFRHSRTLFGQWFCLLTMIKHRIDVSEPKKKAESDIDSLFRTVEKRDVFRKEVGSFRKTSQKLGILEGAIFYSYNIPR